MLAPLEAPSWIKIATLTLIIWQFTFVTDVETYSYENRIISKEEYDLLGPYPCPGLYCGRSLVNNSFYSECGKCDRGWRVSNNTHSICEKCTGTPIKNDWFFLAFHVILVIVLHWGFIDFSARRRSFTKEVLFLHTCAFIEVAIAAIITGNQKPHFVEYYLVLVWNKSRTNSSKQLYCFITINQLYF